MCLHVYIAQCDANCLDLRHFKSVRQRFDQYNSLDIA